MVAVLVTCLHDPQPFCGGLDQCRLCGALMRGGLVVSTPVEESGPAETSPCPKCGRTMQYDAWASNYHESFYECDEHGIMGEHWIAGYRAKVAEV